MENFEVWEEECDVIFLIVPVVYRHRLLEILLYQFRLVSLNDKDEVHLPDILFGQDQILSFEQSMCVFSWHHVLIYAGLEQLLQARFLGLTIGSCLKIR